MTRKSTKRIGIGWLVDGSGTGIDENVLLKIEGSNILRIQSKAKPLQHFEYDLDLRDYTVFPTLVDSHAHLTWSGTSDQHIRTDQLKADYDIAQNTIKYHLDQHLACGVIAVRDGGDRFGHTLRFKNDSNLLKRQKIHISAAGFAWHAPGRYGRLIGKAPSKGHLLSDAILAEDFRGDHLKIVNSGLNSLVEFGRQTFPQFDSVVLSRVVEIAHLQKRKVMVHANGELPVKLALEAGCDSVEHGFFMGYENLAAMAEKQVTWVPTAVTMQAYTKKLSEGSLKAEMACRNLDQQLEQLRMARKLGVKVAVGTDAGSLGVHHGFSLMQEVKLLIEAGYRLDEAVGCASKHGACLLSLNDHGILTRGMQANFIGFRGKPEEVINRLKPPEVIFLKGKWIKSIPNLQQ